MKFQKSLTPRSTDVGPVNYSTLSDGSVMKIPMKSSHGFPPRNSTMPKISFPTFIPLIPTNLDPYLVYNLLPQFPDPFRYFLPKTVVKSYILPILPIFSSDPSAFQENKIFYIQQNFLQDNSTLPSYPPLPLPPPHPHPIFPPSPPSPLSPSHTTSPPSSP